MYVVLRQIIYKYALLWYQICQEQHVLGSYEIENILLSQIKIEISYNLAAVSLKQK